VTLQDPGTLTHHPFFVIGSLYESSSAIRVLEWKTTRER